MSLGEGFGVRFRWVVGGWFPVENEGKGEGAGESGGGEVATGTRTGKSMHMRLSKLPFRDLPFSFSPIHFPSKIGLQQKGEVS